MKCYFRKNLSNCSCRNTLENNCGRNILLKCCGRNTLHSFINNLLFGMWKPNFNSTLHTPTALTKYRLSPLRSPGRPNAASWTPGSKTQSQCPPSAAFLSFHHTASCCSPGIPKFPPVWHSTWQIR